MRRYEFSVYFLTNRWHNVLYTGVTNDLIRRIYEHKHGLVPGFTKKYNINKLVYFEDYTDIHQAIDREKQIKGWVRRKKDALIERENPSWLDLAERWYD